MNAPPLEHVDIDNLTEASVGDAIDMTLARAIAVCRANGRDVIDAKLLQRQDERIALLEGERRGLNKDCLELESKLARAHAQLDTLEHAGEVLSEEYRRVCAELGLAKRWGRELVDELHAVANESADALDALDRTRALVSSDNATRWAARVKELEERLARVAAIAEGRA